MVNSVTSGLNRTLKESEINLEITNDPRQLALHLQSNPAYPGQIFFVDDPHTLELFREQLESVDSFDEDSASSCSDDIGPAEHDMGEEAALSLPFDKKERELMLKINQLQKLYLEASGTQLSAKKQLMPEQTSEQRAPVKASSNTADF